MRTQAGDLAGTETESDADASAATPSGRAAPMARDVRRAAIIAATVPLLRKHGQAVTTRQIAEASGVGEGTIFRVFTDKAELIDACLGAAFDQAPTLERLRAIDPRMALADRVEEVVEILQHRLASVVELLVALGFPQPPEPDGPRRMDPRARRGNSQLLDAIAELLEADRDQLRSSPREVASFIRLFTFAATHPKINDEDLMTARQITDILLHGVGR